MKLPRLKKTTTWVAELQGKVDVIIGAMRLGLDPEYGVEGSGLKAVAAANPELTAIIGGHAHYDIAGQEINGVLVVEPKAYGNRVSKVDITLAKQDGRWTPWPCRGKT